MVRTARTVVVASRECGRQQLPLSESFSHPRFTSSSTNSCARAILTNDDDDESIKSNLHYDHNLESRKILESRKLEAVGRRTFFKRYQYLGHKIFCCLTSWKCLCEGERRLLAHLATSLASYDELFDICTSVTALRSDG